jgi:transmembrane sensor
MASADDREERRMEHAARWVVRAQSSAFDAGAERELAAWLAADPANPGAFDAARTAWDRLGDCAATPEMIAIRRDALEAARRASRAGRPARPGRRGVTAMAAGLAAAVFAGALIAGPLTTTRAQVYETASGQRKDIQLTDGSRISLDEASAVTVRYRRHSRDLAVTRGQAEFKVAHDTTRPFSVSAGSRKVVATGTEFTVELLASSLRVTLLEGRVLVSPSDRPRGASAAPPIELRPLEQLTVTASGQTIIKDGIDPESAEYWKSGKLVFDNEPLSDALDRVNRYSGRKVVLADPRIGAAAISGVFNTGDTRAFLEGVKAQLNLRYIDQTDGQIMLFRDS